MVSSMELPDPAPAAERLLPLALARWRNAFRELTAESTIPVADVYDDAAVFEDPFRLVRGHEAIAAHFSKLNANLRRCRFEHARALVEGSEAALPWTMYLDLRRGPRKEIVVRGLSLIRFGARVTCQRDLFDAGALVYEHVPVLGAAVRFVKRRL